MKTYRHLLLCLTLALLSLCTACWQREGEQQALYEHYAARENLTVAYLTDVKADGIEGDFLILTAPDTTAWFALAKEFGIPRSMAKRNGSTMQYIIGYQSRHNPTQEAPRTMLPSGERQTDIAQSCMSVVDVANQKIFLIFADSEEQYILMKNRIIKKAINP